MKKTTPRINYIYYQKKCRELNDAINSKKEKNIAISGIYGSGKSSLIQTYDKIFNNKKFKDKEFIKKVKKFTRTNTDSSSNKTNLNSHQHKTREDKDTALQELDQDKLNSYLEDLPYKAKEKSLTISLANFNIINDKQLEDEESAKTNQSPIDLSNKPKSQGEVDEKKKIALELSKLDQYNKQRKSLYYKENKQSIDQQIEQSILQQFLFSIDSRKLPASKVKRVTLGSNYGKTAYGVLCFSFVILCLYLINFFSLIWQQNQIASTVFILLEIVSLLVFFCLLPLALKLKSIKIKDLEFIKADPDIKDSLINRYIDEIIYFFDKSGVKIVYLEDLDRLPDLSIFNKLRELNFILNNYFNNKKFKKRKISFVYCISDSIITDYEERSKFFDKIISIEPFFTEATIATDIEKLLKASGAEQTTEFATDMAHFITDKRLYVNIENDFKDKIDSYVLAYKHNPSDNEIIKIFAMSVYKNIYYFDYNKFNTGKSCLSRAFELLSYLRQEFIEENQKQINFIDENNNISLDTKRERENLCERIQIAKTKPVKTFMRITDCDLIKNNSIYICLFKGYIENDFLRYVFFNKADMLVEDDSIFVRLNNLGEIQSPAKNNYRYKLFDLDKIVGKIYLDNFDTSNILNFDLVNWLLKRNSNTLEDKYWLKQHTLIVYLKSDDKPLYNFYCEFLLENGKQEIKNLINFVYNSNYFLTAFKDDLNKLEIDKQNFILNCLLGQDFENMSDNNKSTLLEILNKHTNWENIKLSDNLIDRLKNLGKLQIETFEGLNKEYSKLVIDKACFAINYKNLNFISQKLLKNDDENYILLSFLNDNGADSFKTYILENLSEVLECLSNSQNLNETAIKGLLNNNLISDESKQLIIGKCNFEIKNTDDIDEKYIGLIIQNDKLSYDIETIFEVFVNYEDIDLHRYFNTENYPKLNLANKNNILNNENYEKFKGFLIENFLLADNAIRIFTDFNINEIELDTKYETTFDTKLSNLVKEDFIAFSANNFSCLINCYDAYFELSKRNEEEYMKLIENQSTRNSIINGKILSYIVSKTTNTILQNYIIDNLTNLIDVEFKYNNIVCVDIILAIIENRQLKSKVIIIKLFNFINNDHLKEQRLKLLINNHNLLTDDELIACVIKIGHDLEKCNQIEAVINKNDLTIVALSILKQRKIISFKKIKKQDKFLIKKPEI